MHSQPSHESRISLLGILRSFVLWLPGVETSSPKQGGVGVAWSKSRVSSRLGTSLTSFNNTRSVHHSWLRSILPASSAETMVEQKPVAFVVGASRGIARQIAIDLAKTGYAGECHLQAKVSVALDDPTVVVAAKSTSGLFSTTGASFPPDPNSQQSTTSITTFKRENPRG